MSVHNLRPVSGLVGESNLSHGANLNHIPNLKEIIPSQRTQKTSYSESGEKFKKVETINNVDWYPRFVKNDNCLSLSETIPEKELQKMFLVCFHLLRGNQKPAHYFAAFPSPLDFVQFLKPIPIDNWSFFEYIIGDRAQKLYFDVDIKKEAHEQVDPQGEIDEFANNLITWLVRGILETFSQLGITLDLTRHLLLFSSHSDKKRSYHLIVDRYLVTNHVENYNLASRILTKIPEIYIQFIDMGMYSSKQQLRLLGSQKPGSGRPKIFVSQWLYDGTLIKSRIFHEVEGAITDLELLKALKFTTVFLASCVTYTSQSQFIPNLTDLTSSSLLSIQRKKKYESNQALKECRSDLLEILQQRLNPQLLSIYRISPENRGSVITLMRKKGVSNYCSLCNHIHDNDNAFLTIRPDGKVYFHCFGLKRHRHRNPNGASSMYVADISDLLQPKLHNIDQSGSLKLVGNLESVPPSIITRHQEIRLLGVLPNPVFKPKRF